MTVPADAPEWSPLSRAVVGFDLDLTLLDTREATLVALRAIDPGLPAAVDLGRCLTSAAELRAELGRHLPERQVEEALRRYRAAAAAEGADHVRPMPGAVDALAEVRRHGGRAVVITGRRPEIAAVYLRAAGLTVDLLVGGAAGPEKVRHMKRHALDVYLGDHPLDMTAAAAAGVFGVGVATGYATAERLRAAGARLVVGSLTSFNGVDTIARIGLRFSSADP
jgi:phosphoglycolate phosphatase